MTKLQHTPGPWKIDKKYNGDIQAPDGFDVATCGGLNRKTPIDEVKANARLIAAAPEMMDVLIGLYKLICLKSGADIKELVEVIEHATGLKIEEVLECTE